MLAAGDAAIALHPLARRGIFSALTTGLGAAGAVGGYVADAEHAAIEYRSGYRETYASERRFADLPFWARTLTAVSAG